MVCVALRAITDLCDNTSHTEELHLLKEAASWLASELPRLNGCVPLLEHFEVTFCDALVLSVILQREKMKCSRKAIMYQTDTKQDCVEFADRVIKPFPL